MRYFVLVSATRASFAGEPAAHGSGIRKLKRGVTLHEFAIAYLDELKITKFEEYPRGETLTVLASDQGVVLSWCFTKYPEDELLSAVSHLSKEELLRDLKELLPLRAELT